MSVAATNSAGAVRFQVQPYKPDTGFALSGMAMLLSSLAIVGAALGFVAHFISQYFWLIILFPALIGGALGAVGARMTRQGRVRNPWIGGLAGFLGGALAMLLMHYFDYRTFKDDTVGKLHPDIVELAKAPPAEQQRQLAPLNAEDRSNVELALRAARVDGFGSYLDFNAHVGVQINKATSGKDKGLNLGYYGSYTYWAIEVLIVAGITFAMVRKATATPFCRDCDQWKNAKVLGGFTGDATAAAAAVNAGDLSALATAGPATGGPAQLTVACCDACVGRGSIDVQLDALTVDAKGNTSTKTLAHATYPAAALPYLVKLFEPQPVSVAPADGTPPPPMPA